MIYVGIAYAVMGIVCWFIVMGFNPKEWKGGKKDDQGTGNSG